MAARAAALLLSAHSLLPVRLQRPIAFNCSTLTPRFVVSDPQSASWHLPYSQLYSVHLISPSCGNTPIKLGTARVNEIDARVAETASTDLPFLGRFFSSRLTLITTSHQSFTVWTAERAHGSLLRVGTKLGIADKGRRCCCCWAKAESRKW